jgi:MoaA/NifB/PqqE/SkfB family radical SAM enzyme
MPSLTYTEICRAIDESIEKRQIENVLLSGGEPTLHPDFLNIVKYISERGLKMSLLTNAIKFSNNEFVEKLEAYCDIKNTDITIAFHSHIPQMHDDLTQHKNSFNLSFRGAVNLIKKGAKLSVKNNIVNYTYMALTDYVDWVNENFPDNITLLFANIDVNGVALRNKEAIGVHFNESMPFLTAALDKVIAFRKKNTKRIVKVLTTPLCLIDPYYWGFIENKTQETIDAYIVPDIEEQNPLRFDVSSDSGPMFAACKECELKSYCPGTWRSFKNNYDESILKRIYAE